MTQGYAIKVAAIAIFAIGISCLATFLVLSNNRTTDIDAPIDPTDPTQALADEGGVVNATTTGEVTQNAEVATSTTTPAEVSKVATPVVVETDAAPKLAVLKLKVPYHTQQYVNSCEASSLRMALGYYGINVTDMDLVNSFGYMPKMKDVVNNIWDDPQKMFVGFVDIASSTAGYGVYGKPVAKAAEAYGREAEYVTSLSPTDLAAEIVAGHPVLIWGYSSLTAPAYTWNLADGGTVTAFHGEHVRTVVGVYGDPKDPTGFYVHDPMVGAYVYWTKAKFIQQFNAVPGVTNQAVIVE